MQPPTLSPLPLRRVAITDSLKWIDGHESFGDPGALVFDLAADPGERHNHCGEDLEACRRLEASARAWEAGLQPREPIDQRTGARVKPNERGDAEPAAVPPAEREKLRALGYVD